MAEVDQSIEPVSKVETFVDSPEEEEDEIEFDNIDLKPHVLAATIQNHREMALGRDVSPDAAAGALSLPEIIGQHSRSLGITDKQLARASANQGFDLGLLVDAVGRRGEDPSDVFKTLKEKGTVAFDEPHLESRKEAMRKFRKSRLVKTRGAAINRLGQQRVRSYEKQFDHDIDDLREAAQVEYVDFRKIKDSSKRQSAVAQIVYDMGSQAGLSNNQMAAIIANGFAESQLDPFAVPESGENSHGIWQFNRDAGEGVGHTVEQLQDPRFQMTKIIEAVGTRDELAEFRDENADANELTKQFMVRFEKPADQEDSDIKKRQAYLKQAQRLLDQAEKNSPRSKRILAEDREKRQETLNILQFGNRGKFVYKTDEDAAGGDVRNEIAAPGTDAANQIDRDVEELTNPEVSSNPERAKIMQEAIAKYGEDSIHNVFAESSFEKIMNAGLDYDTALAAKNLGQSVNEFMINANVDGSREQKMRDEMLIRNRNHYAKYLTSHKVGVPAFMSYEFMDPKNLMGEKRVGKGEGYWKRLFHEASRNRVELVGMDSEGRPVFRGEGYTQGVFNKLNLHLSMGAGGIDRALNGPEGESIMESLKEGSIEGVREAKDFTKLMLSTETAREGGWKAAGLGVTGALIDILTPDPTFALAKVASKSKQGAQKISNIVKRKHLPKTLDDMGSAATDMIDAQILTKQAEESFASGNYDQGIAFLGEAKTAAAKAEGAERSIRDRFDEVMTEVDRTDSNIALEISREVPTISGRNTKELDESLGFSDFGLNRDYVHPSVERVITRGESASQLIKYSEFFDVSRKLERLEEAALKIKNNETQGAYFKKIQTQAIDPLKKSLAEQLKNREFVRGKSPDQSEEVSKAIGAVFDFLGSAQASKLIETDPKRFQSILEQHLTKLPVKLVKGRTIMDHIYLKVDDAHKVATGIAKNAQKSEKAVDLNKQLVESTKSIAALAESRGAAHAFVRQAVADLRKIDIDPVISTVTNRYDEIGNDKISATALMFRTHLEEAFPAMRGDAAMHVARNLDERLKAIHRQTGERIELIYDSREFKNIIPDLKRQFADLDVDDVSAAVTDPKFTPLAFGEELLTSKEVRDFTADLASAEDVDFIPGMVVKVEDGTLSVKSIELPKELQKKGIATALYKVALARAKREGLGFASDINPSPDAQRVYARLIDEGVPFTRLEDGVPMGTGKMPPPPSSVGSVSGPPPSAAIPAPGEAKTIQFVLSKEAVAKMSDNLLKVGKAQTKKAADAGDLSDFVEDTQKVVRALEEAPTIEDFMLAINKVARRELDADQMGKVVKWLGTKGIAVEHQGAAFVAEDPAVVARAEEAFAKAFAAFAKGRPPPTPSTESAFRQVLNRVLSSFASAKNAQVDGAKFNPSSEIESVFLGLLAEEAPTKSVTPNLLKLIKRALLDDLPDKVGNEYLLRIAQESYRMGYPISVKEIKSLIVDAAAKQAKSPDVEVTIDLPGPVSLGGILVPKTGSSYTLLDFGRGAAQFATRKRMLGQPATRGMALESQMGAIKELTPTQIIDQYIKTSKPIAKGARFMYLGDDVLEDMRDLPPKVRKAIMAGVRMTQQSIGDAVTIISEGDIKKLIRYLTGDPQIKFKSGRNAFSAGHDKMGSAVNAMAKYFRLFADPAQHPTNAEHFDFLQDLLAKPIGKKGSFESGDMAKAEKAFQALVFNPSGDLLLTDIFKATGLNAGDSITHQHLDILESIFYITGNLTRGAGQYGFAAEGVEKSIKNFEDLYGRIGKHFKPKKWTDPPVANRVAVLIAGHGQAAKERLEWVNLGIAVDANTAENFKRWIMGESLDSVADLQSVRQAFQVYGYNPRFLEAANLEGLNFYVPAAARRKLSMALTQASDPQLKKFSGDMLEALGKGIRETESHSQLAMAWTARYLKTRMVRGHFLLKSRYFFMNTMDHFNQMGQIVGFRPAFISTMRILPQTFFTNPLTQSVVMAAQKAGKDDAGEVLRSALTAAGDRGADWAATLTRASKWRGDLNAVLEGRQGFMVVDGVPHAFTDLRRIGAEEGLSASFDTAELGTKIRQTGDMFTADSKKRSGLMRIPGAPTTREWVKIAEDIAEAWSERERYGAMMTLVEMGVDPRTAARLVIDALYDYAGSMSKMDRHWIMNIFFPFWAFQKNANRQLVDVLFSPRGAYRLGVLNRGYTQSAELITELLYEDLVDPMGINLAVIEAMDPTSKELYEGLKAQLSDEFGMPASQFPVELKRQIRMAFSARSSLKENGNWYKINKVGRDLRDDPKYAKYRGLLTDAFVPKPSRSSIPIYDAPRTSVMMPYAWNEQNKKFHELMNRTEGTDRTFATILLPEQSYIAAARHMIMATLAVTGMLTEIRNKGPDYISGADDGGDLFRVTKPLLDLFQPERGLIVSDLVAATNLSDSAVPYRLAQPLAKLMYDSGYEILPVTPKEDPLTKKISYSQMMQDFKEGKISTVPEDPFLRGETLTTTNRYYLSGGVGTLILKNSIFDEFNAIMKKFEQTPREEHEGIRGELMRWARTWGIVDIRDVNPKKVAAGEAYEDKDIDRDYIKDFKPRQRLAYLDEDDYPEQKDNPVTEKPKPKLDSESEERLRRLKSRDPGDMEIDI